MGLCYHADLHISALSAADPARPDGTLSGPGTQLIDPGPGARIVVRHVTISTDTAQRVALGTADVDGGRIRAGSFAQNGGVAPDCHWEGPLGARISVWHAGVGSLDVSVDYELAS